MIKDIKIREYGSSEKIKLNDEEIKFIRKTVNKNDTSSNLEIRAFGSGEFRLRASSSVGVIQLPGNQHRIQIDPKISKIRLLHMICYTLNARSKLYNIKSLYEQGESYLDIIAFLFNQELSSIIKQGLFKGYINREEDIRYLRGRVLIREQLRCNTIRKDRLFCSYDDLCHDVLLNQIVLFALHLLTRIVHNRELRLELLTLRDMLSTEVTLRAIDICELESIHLNRLNEYYQGILDLSKIIIQNSYIKDLSSGSISAFCFLMDMNDLFEKFILKILREEAFSDYLIEEQSSASNLVIPHKVRVKPDILIKSKSDRKLRLILDTKYKKSPTNSDFYQILAYSIAHEVDGVLLYPEHIQQQTEDYQVNKEGIDECLHVRSIDLGEEVSIDECISRIRDKLRAEIEPLIQK